MEKKRKRLIDPGNNVLCYYQKEIGKMEVPTAKEEKELMRRTKDGDKSAETELMERNQRLVVSIALRFNNLARHLKLSDLIQEGNLGLRRAIKKSKPELGYKLSTYATWWIREAIIRAIEKQDRSIYLPRHILEFYQNYKTISKEFFNELGRKSTLDEIAERMKMPAKKLRKIINANQDILSLDERESQDTESGNVNFFEILADDRIELPEKEIVRSAMKEDVAKLLNSLGEREKNILKMRFGFDEELGEMTLKKIGKVYNVSHEWIRQIQAGTMKKLKRRAKKLPHLQAYLEQKY